MDGKDISKQQFLRIVQSPGQRLRRLTSQAHPCDPLRVVYRYALVLLAFGSSVASALSTVTRTASRVNPLFASNLCFRSKPFTNSRAALAMAPAMVEASTLTVVPSEPLARSS